MTTGDSAATRQCAWCAAPADDGQTHCSACGAALPVAETAGNLVIPGVTHVDASLKSYAARPVLMPGFVLGQPTGAGVIEALTGGGGPVVAALGALAAMAANEYLTNRTERQPLSAHPTSYASAAPNASQPISPAGQPARPETFEETMRRLDARLAPDNAE